VGGGHQGGHLSKSALLLLDRYPSTNPKVVEGCFVGDEQVKGVTLSWSTQRDQERGAVLHGCGGKGGPEALGTAPSPRLAMATTSQFDLGCGTHARGMT